MQKEGKKSTRDSQEDSDSNCGSDVDRESGTKLKYPRSIFFIVSNEFCERFSYYGMRTILTLYLRNKLNYSDDTSTVIYHVFTMFAYFFPLLGAILADSWLGKFRTIFYVSIIYAIGQLLLALSAAPVVGLPPREFSLVGLLLIALGTGGIKPCVAAFGGDQFLLPQQERFLSTFFSLFYFSINSGSVISSFITPILRTWIPCFGDTTCYSLAFFIPAALMALSIVIFVLGKPLYRIIKPSGNVVLSVCKCISKAICNKVKSKDRSKKHWLDYAEGSYDRSLIKDVKATLQVLKLFLPLPVFWALFDQQGSRWTIQATRMDGQLGNYLIQPDQMQVVNPLLVLIFIPLFEACIYPLIAKIHINTPLRKLTVGGLLAALAFAVSAIVEWQLENTDPILPSKGLAQTRVYNSLDCPIAYTIEEESFTVGRLSMHQIADVMADGKVSLNYKANFSACIDAGHSDLPEVAEGQAEVAEMTATSLLVTPHGPPTYTFLDDVGKSKSGYPLVRSLLYMADYGSDSQNKYKLRFLKNDKLVLEEKISSTPWKESALLELIPDKYDIHIDSKKILSNVDLRLGGVYSIVGHATRSKEGQVDYVAGLVTVTEPNSIHILWLVPQYILITMGEIMFSVTGLEFAFTQSPDSMKSLLQACWLLTVAFGNLIVVIVAEVSVFSKQLYEFLLFAGLMVIDILIFAVMARFYKYVDPPGEEGNPQEQPDNIELKNGRENPSYRDDDD